MYNYFDSKEDLLHSIIMGNFEEHEVWWTEFLAMDVSPYEKIKLTTEKSIEVVKNDLHHWRLLTALVFQPEILKGQNEMMVEKQTQIMGQVVAIFTELGMEEPMKEAFFYGAFLDGMFFHYMQMEDQYPLEDMKNYLLKRYEV